MALRRKKRREVKETELEITAFMNLMVILVPFLLVTAVFSRVTIIDLFLPSASEAQDIKEIPFQLEVTIRADGIQLTEPSSHINRFFAKTKGAYNYDAFGQAISELKARFPKQVDSTLLSEAGVSYDSLVQVMDRLRINEANVAGKRVKQVMFPNISIGDAPGGSS